MQGRLLLDVVILESTAILELLAREDQTLLIWRDALLVLDLGLDSVDGVASLYLESDGLASEGFHEDLHVGADSVRSAPNFLLAMLKLQCPPERLLESFQKCAPILDFLTWLRVERGRKVLLALQLRKLELGIDSQLRAQLPIRYEH